MVSTENVSKDVGVLPSVPVVSLSAEFEAVKNYSVLFYKRSPSSRAERAGESKRLTVDDTVPRSLVAHAQLRGVQAALFAQA